MAAPYVRCMKRGQRSPGSKACPKLNTLPLPVNSIEFRPAAPMASAAAASPVRCCAWLGADSTTANPATRVQYIRIYRFLPGSEIRLPTDCSCNRQPCSACAKRSRATAAASEKHAEPIAPAWNFPASGLEAVSREAISQVGPKLYLPKTVRVKSLSLVADLRARLWKQHLAQPPARRPPANAARDAIWQKSNRACAAVWSGPRILRCGTTTKYRHRGRRRRERRSASRHCRPPAARHAPCRESRTTR